MEIRNTRVRKNRNRLKNEEEYCSDLQFYLQSPNGEVTLSEFDELALERLKILRSVERVNVSGQAKNSEEWMNNLFDDFQKNKYFIMVLDKVTSAKDETKLARRKDHLSHFILRLAYCKNEELRRWFVSHETDLFKARFMRAASNGVNFTNFLHENNLKFCEVPEKELQEESENLVDGTHSIASVDQLENRIFYKVHFTEALDLVKSRRVFVKDGYAYVPSSDLVSLVSLAFRAKLSQALTATCRALPQVDDDERLTKLLNDFDKRYTGCDADKFGKENRHITPEMILKLATTAFPLCMRQIQEQLNAANHAKHGARMQYGLFLKAAGLKLEDAIRFWRSHFIKNMDSEKFEKQYAYNIRHNYGKEGKRVDYTPYGCIKIITGNVGPGDCHGCPFKHTDENKLKQKLIGYNTPQESINEIIELVGKSHYQIACQRYFEAKYKDPIDCGINHPNQYFEESMARLYPGKTPSKGRFAKSEHSSTSHTTPKLIKTPTNCSNKTATKSSDKVEKSLDISGIEPMDLDDFGETFMEELDKVENRSG